MNDETVMLHDGPPSFAYLFWISGSRRGDHVMLRSEGTTIGRGDHVEVALDDPTVSTEHAKIRLEDGVWYLYDLASSNQTKVAGEIVHRRALEDADRLTLGEIELVFRQVR